MDFPTNPACILPWFLIQLYIVCYCVYHVALLLHRMSSLLMEKINKCATFFFFKSHIIHPVILAQVTFLEALSVVPCGGPL